ncbi:hypothetical protein GGP62_003218 [Salinibacter ruber]|uniref:polysaccharide pyruvyl transferase family protein n=1 Tax=Salinibacter ruber TaxID=146919 RepID=UPI00216A0097|nr:polysaccharide pyruvyl transferase family protein [Salinibacter ruber]MCS3708308.1 hypothetical protein [Salinibacter ruber]
MQAEGISRNFGTFIYSTTNLGDDVQTIAQLGFLPTGQDIKALNRDHLDAYDGTERICVMNGWFSHAPNRWPPSRSVDPVFISFHIARDQLAAEKHAAYYRRHEPIGCRDYATVEKLREIGVDAYFSGCLTLTLQNPFDEEERGDYAVIVDAHLSDEKTYPPSEPDLLKRLVPEYVRQNAVYVEHEMANKHAHNYNRKTSRAVELLNLYARAKVVVTTRMHCALPCLALNTPVVFLHREWNTDVRFDGYRQVVPGHGPDAKTAKVDWEEPTPVDVSQMKESLIQDLRSSVERKIDS